MDKTSSYRALPDHQISALCAVRRGPQETDMYGRHLRDPFLALTPFFNTSLHHKSYVTHASCCCYLIECRGLQVALELGPRLASAISKLKYIDFL